MSVLFAIGVCLWYVEDKDGAAFNGCRVSRDVLLLLQQQCQWSKEPAFEEFYLLLVTK